MVVPTYILLLKRVNIWAQSRINLHSDIGLYISISSLINNIVNKDVKLQYLTRVNAVFTALSHYHAFLHNVKYFLEFHMVTSKKNTKTQKSVQVSIIE